ncbi:hypothetical protein BI049_gp192 [Salmonella phage vB_SnwM_CGG4-1]|uniref:Uncharacterized protein n=1 Tax=Salmonella phage vB_SnwM_CGG4-1 TaxID=1815631 RepID=A0A1B0VVL8_9CAUD|nr:hypothetical protein BI049_gp192 [Salmonella phage vB_SnwM_CGG4-1]ANA49541.1 hypothetical protein CGG41_186 [Salmonella phage vB_SnwM_CGG4-1]
MSFNILMEVTVVSNTGAVDTELKVIEFRYYQDADKLFDSMTRYEETPELKIWRQLTKLY